MPVTNPETVYLGTAIPCALAGTFYDGRDRQVPNDSTPPAGRWGLALRSGSFESRLTNVARLDRFTARTAMTRRRVVQDQ